MCVNFQRGSRDNGKENGNYYMIFKGYKDNGKENGNYCMVQRCDNFHRVAKATIGGRGLYGHFARPKHFELG